MVVLIVFAFIAGIVTILSPCILPVLPIVLSGAVGGKAKPFGVVAGFIGSFTFFTLFLSGIVQTTGIPADALRLFSVVTIVGFGLSLLIPQTQVLLEKLFTWFSKFAPKKQKGGFSGGILVGVSLGLIWTPCVGPILASVISLAISGSVSGAAALITLAYAFGTGIPMFAIAIGGNRLLQKVPWLIKHTARIQKAFGVVMILTGVVIYFNIDRRFQTFILDVFPEYGVGLTSIEDNALVEEQLNRLQGRDSNPRTDSQQSYGPAPEIVPGGDWFNSEPFTLADQRGKVVLVDFWTYSCINCIRTLPYLRDWHDKYADKGLVILGVHSPEFEFEKNASNVAEAIADFELEYPIVQDNNFATWRAYDNRYWPAKYLIDKNGIIRYQKFGEGDYEETENRIRELLGEDPIDVESTQTTQASRRERTHEIYLGYRRADAYTSSLDLIENKIIDYQHDGYLNDDQVGLTGTWQITEDAIIANETGARLDLNFIAEKVHLVLEPPVQQDAETIALVTVLLDDQPLPEKYWTQDMNEAGKIVVDRAKKYDVVDLGEDYGRYRLTLVFDSGIEAFAFTFGS